MDLHSGDLIRVRAYGGEIFTGRLVEVKEGTAIVSTDKEYEKAAIENREPICIGFPLSDVLDRVPN